MQEHISEEHIIKEHTIKEHTIQDALRTTDHHKAVWVPQSFQE